MTVTQSELSKLGYRTGIDGSIWLPRRGPVPQVPTGYVKDEMNPYKFWKVIPECSKRTIETKIKTSCGCKKIIWKCGDKVITRKDCETCVLDAGTSVEGLVS